MQGYKYFKCVWFKQSRSFLVLQVDQSEFLKFLFFKQAGNRPIKNCIFNL